MRARPSGARVLGVELPLVPCLAPSRRASYAVAMLRAALVAAASVALLAGCRSARPLPERSAIDSGIAPVATGPVLALASASDTPASTYGARWSPSGRWLATWRSCPCPDRAYNRPSPCPVEVWDLPQRRVGHTFEMPCVPGDLAVGWTPTEDLFAASAYAAVRAWKLSDGTPALETGTLAVEGAFDFSPDGTRLLWRDESGNVVLHDSHDGSALRRARVFPEGATLDGKLTFSPDSAYLAVAVQDGPLELWDGHSGALRRSLRVPGVAPVGATRLEWLADGDHFAFGNDGGLLGLASARSGVATVLRRPATQEPTQRQSSLGVSRDGKLLVTLEGDGKLVLWEVPSGRRRERLPGADSSWTSSVDIAPDGRQLALVRGGALELVPVEGGDPRRFPLGADAGPRAMIGWGADGLYYALRATELIACSPGGTAVTRHAPIEPGFGAVLSASRQFLAVPGRPATLLRLRDGATLPLSEPADPSRWRRFFSDDAR